MLLYRPNLILVINRFSEIYNVEDSSSLVEFFCRKSWKIMFYILYLLLQKIDLDM